MSARLVHRPASQVDASWLGRRITVGKGGTGLLSDVVQHPTARRTELWFGGTHVDVHADTNVTTGDLDILGGAL